MRSTSARGRAPRRTAVRWSLVTAVVGFIGLAVIAHVVAPGAGPNHDVLQWTLDHRPGWSIGPCVAVTTVASPTSTCVLAAIVAAAWWWRFRDAPSAVTIVGTVAVATGLTALAKVTVAEQRPPGSPQFLLGVYESFPSGHVTGTVALAGIAAVVVGRGRRRAVRIALGVAVAAATSAVALTRLVLGVHWLIDVAGGLLLGGATVAAGALVLEAARHGRRASPRFTRVTKSHHRRRTGWNVPMES